MKVWKKFSILAAVVLLMFTWRPVLASVVNALWDFVEIGAPSTPSGGVGRIYFDSTGHLLSSKNSSGTVTHTVATSSCSAGTPVVGNINADGTVTCAAGGGGGGGIQATNLLNGGAIRTSLTLTFNFASQAADILAVCIGWEGGAATNPTLSDSAMTSYTKIVQLTGQTQENIALFIGTVPSSPGTLTFTYTIPASAISSGINAIELLNSTATTDGSAVSTTGTGSTSPIMFSPTATGDTIVGCVQGNANGGNTYPPAGFAGVVSNGDDSGGIVYSIVGIPTISPVNFPLVSGSNNGNFPFNNSANQAYAVVALKHP